MPRQTPGEGCLGGAGGGTGMPGWGLCEEQALPAHTAATGQQAVCLQHLGKETQGCGLTAPLLAPQPEGLLEEEETAKPSERHARLGGWGARQALPSGADEGKDSCPEVPALPAGHCLPRT